MHWELKSSLCCNTECYVSDQGQLLCPTIAKKPKKQRWTDCCHTSCPVGSSQLSGSEIETTYFGGMPKILNRPGKSLEGSVVYLMNLLGKKYDFKYSTVPSRTPNTLIANVSLIVMDINTC